MSDSPYSFVFVEEIDSKPDGKYFTFAVCKGNRGEKIILEDPITGKSVEMESIFKCGEETPSKIFFSKEKDNYNVLMLKTIKIEKELFKRFLKIYYKWGRKYV